MKTKLFLEQRLAVLLMVIVLAISAWWPLGAHMAARKIAAGATEPRVIAVNWNARLPSP